MKTKWWGVGLLVLALGCKSAQPNLKPTISKQEDLVVPPAEQRFQSPSYPKQALNSDDNSRKTFLPQDKGNVVPARGNMMGSGMGAPGGMR